MSIGNGHGAPRDSGAENLLHNPGFSRDEALPVHWFISGKTGTGAAVADDPEPHTGDSCLRIELTQPMGLPVDWDVWIANQVVSVAPAADNALFRYSGWYRSAPGCNARPTVVFVNGAGESFDCWGGWDHKLPTSEEWNYFDGVFRLPEGADRLNVGLWVDGTPGTVWWDDVSLMVADAQARLHADNARKLKEVVGDLEEWWCALMPGRGGVEFLLHDVHDLDLLMQMAGPCEEPAGFIGAVVTFFQPGGTSTVVRQPLLTPEGRSANASGHAACHHIVLDALAPPDWNGNVLARLEVGEMGDTCVVLGAVKATQQVRDGLAVGRIADSFVSLGTPWQTTFSGQTTEELETLQARNYDRHLWALVRPDAGDAAVIAQDSLTKRRPDQWRDDLLTGRLEPTDRVSLLCAGGETESFQVLFVAGASRPDTLTADMSELRTARGATIAADASEVHLVEYVPFEGKWWPDPLFSDQPFFPSEDGPVVFWVNVSVPPGQEAGAYHGTLRVRTSGGAEAVAELSVRVLAFSLPRESSLCTSIWFSRERVARWFGLADGVSSETFARYVALAAKYRLTLIDVAHRDPMVEFHREPDGSLSYDWSRWDRYLLQLMETGAQNVDVGMSCGMMRWFSDMGQPILATDRLTGERVAIAETFLGDAHLQLLSHFVAAAAEHVRSLGFGGLLTVEPWDEPLGEWNDKVHQVLRAIKRAAPEVRGLYVGAANQVVGFPHWQEVVDIWCPTVPVFGANIPKFEAARARGEIMWWYVCLSPVDPYANLFISQAVLENRLLFAQTWQHHLTGFLYWGIAQWTHQKEELPPERFPDVPWCCYTTGYTSADGHFGDGYLIYPGRDVDRPLVSIRITTVRDGIEDYEYLQLLHELSQDRDVPDEVRELLAVPSEVCSSLTDFTRDPGVFRRYRQRLAYWIERLSPDQATTEPVS